MKALLIFVLAVEECSSLEQVMLLLHPGRGSEWYGACFANAGEYGIGKHWLFTKGVSLVVQGRYGYGR